MPGYDIDGACHICGDLDGSLRRVARECVFDAEVVLPGVAGVQGERHRITRRVNIVNEAKAVLAQSFHRRHCPDERGLRRKMDTLAPVGALVLVA